METVRTNLEAERGSTRRAALAGGGAALAAAALAPEVARAATPRRTQGRVADLTHEFRAGIVTFAETDVPVERRTIATTQEQGFYAQAWSFGEHSATHVDAPGHFDPDGRRVTALRPSELIAPAAVIDISARARRNADAAVTVADLRRYERRHGRIARNAIVLMYSGWERRIGDANAFRNPDAGGTYHFPGFSPEAAEWLLDHRRGRALGVDTLSLDPGASKDFAVHTRWLGANRFGIENVANLRRIPPAGAQVIVGVVPWQDGSGGPARVLATY